MKVDLLGNAARTTEDRNQREWELGGGGGGGGGGAGGELGEGIMLGMVLGRFGDCFCSDFPNGYKQVTNLTRPNNNIQKPRWYDMGWPSAVTRN